MYQETIIKILTSSTVIVGGLMGGQVMRSGGNTSAGGATPIRRAYGICSEEEVPCEDCYEEPDEHDGGRPSGPVTLNQSSSMQG